MPLPNKYRITGKKEIDGIFKNGRTVKGVFLFIRILKNQKEYSRFAFIIPIKHIPLAVDRNKIRRMFSGDIAKLRLPQLGYDIIAVVYKKAEKSRFKELVIELNALLLKIQNQNI